MIQVGNKDQTEALICLRYIRLWSSGITTVILWTPRELNCTRWVPLHGGYLRVRVGRDVFNRELHITVYYDAVIYELVSRSRVTRREYRHQIVHVIEYYSWVTFCLISFNCPDSHWIISSDSLIRTTDLWFISRFCLTDRIRCISSCDSGTGQLVLIGYLTAAVVLKDTETLEIHLRCL